MVCVSQAAGPASRRRAWLALVHRNAALGEAPVGQPSFGREAHISLRLRPWPRRNGLRTPLGLVSKDSLAIRRPPTKRAGAGPEFIQMTSSTTSAVES